MAKTLKPEGPAGPSSGLAYRWDGYQGPLGNVQAAQGSGAPRPWLPGGAGDHGVGTRPGEIVPSLKIVPSLLDQDGQVSMYLELYTYTHYCCRDRSALALQLVVQDARLIVSPRTRSAERPPRAPDRFPPAGSR